MLAFLNGRFLPVEQATVSVLDRGFILGDGLFETMRAVRGRLLFWPDHLARLRSGAEALGIPLEAGGEDLGGVATELLGQNGLSDAVVRIQVSRGPGVRGYSPRGAGPATRVVTVHPPASPAAAERGWRLRTWSGRVQGSDAFARHKTGSKLRQILARAEAEAAGADEALLLTQEGHLCEAAAANLFWIRERAVFTPSLEAGCLAGVTRSVLLRTLRQEGWQCDEVLAPASALGEADGVLLTLASLGVVEVVELDGNAISRSGLLHDIRGAYQRACDRHLSD